MWLAIQKFVSAIFNGVPSDELGKYTTQTTAVIGVYICFIAIFLTGLYVGDYITGRRLSMIAGMPWLR